MLCWYEVSSSGVKTRLNVHWSSCQFYSTEVFGKTDKQLLSSFILTLVGEIIMDNSQIENTISEIRKRSGVVTAFNKDKISNAIYQALAATSKADRGVADKLADDVVEQASGARIY